MNLKNESSTEFIAELKDQRIKFERLVYLQKYVHIHFFMNTFLDISHSSCQIFHSVFRKK